MSDLGGFRVTLKLEQLQLGSITELSSFSGTFQVAQAWQLAERRCEAHGKHMLLLAALALGPDLAEAARQEVARQECRLKDKDAGVTVCGRREQKNHYQVTNPGAPYDPGGNLKGAMTERMGWIAEGDSGIGSCSNIGPSAGTGCFEKAWRRTLQQKGWLVR